MNYACDRCLTPMLQKNDVLYRTCDCKKSGYIPQGDAIPDVPENLVLMPFKAALDPLPTVMVGLSATGTTLAQVGEIAPTSGVPLHQDVLVALPTDKQERKATPLASGVLDYFPAALAEIARVSKAGNDQHNPGQRLHWARGKSSDHADCIARHLIQRGTRDEEDGQRHSAKMAWRALALLQEELEAEAGFVPQAARIADRSCPR